MQSMPCDFVLFVCLSIPCLSTEAFEKLIKDFCTKTSIWKKFFGSEPRFLNLTFFRKFIFIIGHSHAAHGLSNLNRIGQMRNQNFMKNEKIFRIKFFNKKNFGPQNLFLKI